jgi:hypothetical protein
LALINERHSEPKQEKSQQKKTGNSPPKNLKKSGVFDFE